jgi:hypothetical protein
MIDDGIEEEDADIDDLNLEIDDLEDPGKESGEENSE